MTPTATTTRMTAEEFMEFCALPENQNRCLELVRGEVVDMGLPFKRHGFVCINVGFLLSTYTRQRGYAYLTGNDSGVILERDPDTVRGPDIALYEDAQTYEEIHPKYGENAPVLAVEVLSASDKPGRIHSKLHDYLTNGVRVVWLIDTDAKIVWVYRPNQPPLEFRDGTTILGGDELPGLSIPVRDLFFVAGKPPAATPGDPK